MKNKKRLALMAVALTMMVSSSAVILTTSGCGDEQSDVQIEYQTLTGSYYVDINGAESSITFSGSSFNTTLSGESGTGSYLYDGQTVTLKFSDDKTVTAKFEDGNFKFTYNNVEYSMLPKTTYQVTYNLDGGTGTTSAEVVNGRTATKPANPGKVGYTFVGWYADSQYTTAYSFDTAISGDTIIYARFIKNLDSEYTLSFDLGYEGGTLDSVATVGGYAYNLPVPERTGYSFVGWWTSDYESATKLTTKVENGHKISASTTLYAVWSSDATAVSVTASGVSWESMGTNKSYQVVIAAPDGTEEVKSVRSTNYSYNFAEKAAGDYVIQVTVNGNTAFAYYRNKGLSKVTLFKVEGNVLAFNKVDNATNYILSFTCGTADHDHTEVDLGDQTTFDFSNCEMVKGGFNFTVKAVAEGYAQSVSEVYNVNRTLAAVTGLTVDSATDTVKWTAVEGATYYKVEITKGEKTETFNVSDKTSYDLTSYYGDVSISVYPVAFGYNSPDATQVNYTKTRLTTPANIHVSDGALVWDAVEDAQSYKVTINGTAYTVTGASLPITDEYFAVGTTEFTLSVQAIASDAANNSLVTDNIQIRRASMNDNLKYANGVVSWDPVIGVDKYGVKVNDGTEIFVNGDATSSAITFTTDGYNTISVRCYSDDNVSSWVEKTVYVNKITFNANGGTVVTNQLVATGDNYTLPTSNRTGYTLLGWYTAMSDGTKIDDSLPYSLGDKNLYAHWTANTYSVTLSVAADEGTLGDNGTTASVKYAQNFTLPVPTGSDATKLFLGWYSGENAYTDADGVGTHVWNDITDVTLVPRWVEVFKFELVTLNNQQVYAVSKADGINEFKTVTIPATYKGVKVGLIENECFKNCSTLQVVNIPDTIEYITLGDEGNNSAGHGFYGCSALKAVNIYHVEGNNSAAYSSSDGMLLYNNPRTGAVELKFVPSSFTGELVIPDGVTIIPNNVLRSSTITAVTIPASVTEIGQYAFASCYNLKNVNFKTAESGEEQALNISEKAFWLCKSLTSITIPARVVLDEFTDSDGSTTSWFAGVFSACDALEYITIEKSTNATYTSVDGLVYKDNGSTLYYVPTGVSGEIRLSSRVITIASYAFDQCNLITKITIPGNVGLINSRAFNRCSNVTEIEFLGRDNDPPLTIKSNGFYGLDKVESVTLPENLLTMEEYAFACSNLTEVTVNNALDNCSYANNSFVDINKKPVVKTLIFGEKGKSFEFMGVFGTSLKDLQVSENNATVAVENGVLFNYEKTNILYVPDSISGAYVLPESVTTIGANAFYGKLNLTEITIGKNVTSVGDGAFMGCMALTTVTFEEEGTEPLEIGAEAFVYCNKLANITFPSRLKKIGNGAFVQCSALVTVDLSQTNVEELGHFVFNYDSALTTVKFPATLTKIGQLGEDNAYKCTTLSYNKGVLVKASSTVVNVKSDSKYYGLTTIYEIFNGGIDIFENSGALETVTFEDGNSHYKVIDGMIYETDESGNPTVLNYNPIMNTAASGALQIPATVTDVKFRAFYKNTKITSVEFLSEGDINFGSYIFDSCTSITNVVLPKKLSAISRGMFSGATKLATISTIPNTVSFIGHSAFYKCSSLKGLEFEEGNETNELVLEDGYNNGSYYYGVFSGCSNSNFKTLTLPERTTEIGAYAFHYYEYEEDDEGDSYYYGKPAINTLNLPSTLKRIGEKAFESDTYLYSVTFASKENATANLVIEDNAFIGASLKYGITLPNTLKSIGNNAFSGTSLYYNATTKTLTIPASVQSIGNSAFASAKMTELTFEEGSQLTELGTGVFSSTNLVTVKMANCTKLTTLSNNTFYYCSKLATIDIAEWKALKKIGTQAFRNCNATSFTSITLPATVEEIASNAFWNCNKLTEINFATANGRCNLKSVGDLAFQSCSKLTAFTFPESNYDITLGASLFKSCSALTTVNISNSIKEVGKAFSDSSTSLKNINIDSTNSSLKTVVDEDGNTKLILGKDASGNAVSLLYVHGAPTLSEDGTYTIPDYITYIGKSAFLNQKTIKKLVVPASVQTIADEAFKGCTGLTSIEFTGTSQLTTIGSSAFEGCTSLTSIALPEGGLSLGQKAFYKDTALTSAVLPQSLKTIGSQVFYGCTKLETANVPAVTSEKISGENYSPLSEMFSGCTSLKSVTISEGLTFIGYKMFSGCTSLTDITLPESAVTIGYNALEKCTSLKTATIKGNVELFEITDRYSRLFLNCTALETVVLNNSIEQLGNGMFEGCSSLKTIKTYNSATKQITGADNEATLPSYLTTIGGGTFQATGIVKITIPSGVKVFNKTGDSEFNESSDSYLFYNCPNLTTVILNDAITGIGAYAFARCPSLKTIQYMSNGELVGNENEVTLPSSLTILGRFAFGSGRGREVAASSSYFGSGIEKLVLPDLAVENLVIGVFAFQDCTSLREVVVGTAVTKLGVNSVPFTAGSYSYIFDNCSSLEKVMLHDKFTGIGEGTFRGCTSLKTIGYITSDGEEVVEENVVQLPASLTVLGNFAFGSGNSYVTKIKSNATGVEKVIISATVKSIGYGLFEDCTSLSSVENYGTVCSARMFDGCTSLESVVLNNNTTSIGDYAFNNCSSLTTIKYYVQDSNIVLGNANEVTLPAGVTSVGNYVFSGCSAITTVVFNGEVTSIGTSAFQNCTSLANITVPETATVATNAFDGCTSLPTTEEEGEDA